MCSSRRRRSYSTRRRIACTPSRPSWSRPSANSAMARRRIVIALGGNALPKRGEAMTVANQRENVRVAARAIAPVTADNDIVISHGNGPQVGLLALQAAASGQHTPLDVLGAETEGMIGYMIE